MLDKQRLYAAFVRSKERFCIAIVETDEDDPYSFILVYDSRNKKHWTRYDVKAVVTSIASYVDPKLGETYAALTREGGVVFIGKDETQIEAIPLAGIGSDDKPGRGRLSSVAEIAGVLYAAGANSQVYRRDGADLWNDISSVILAPEPGFDAVSFRCINGVDYNELYVCGYADPHFRDFTQEERRDLSQASKDNDFARARAILDAVGDPNRTIKARAFRWEGAKWERVLIANNNTLYDICIAADSQVYIAGFGGVLFVSTPSGSFDDVLIRGMTETILSMTIFQGDLVLATERNVFRIRGSSAVSIAPSLRVRSPVKVQAVQDALFYFDYRAGVFRYDQNGWTSIPIRPELTSRY